ncbi:MAG: hypothetical protein HYU76_09735 [Betaproteobacteria bacterium]|nr:hypothetical protein [Betaproteobacteria bacterium]
MRKDKQIAFGSDIYKLIRQARMSEYDRRLAFNATRQAEAFAAAVMWVKEKAAALGNYLLKPSLKH